MSPKFSPFTIMNRWLFLTGTDELQKMARRIFKPSVSSDSPVNFMCNNMGFLKNLLSGDFGGLGWIPRSQLFSW